MKKIPIRKCDQSNTFRFSFFFGQGPHFVKIQDITEEHSQVSLCLNGMWYWHLTCKTEGKHKI